MKDIRRNAGKFHNFLGVKIIFQTKFQKIGPYFVSTLLRASRKFRYLLINKGVQRMPCCNVNFGIILYITTEFLILVESCYSYAQKKRVGIVKNL